MHQLQVVHICITLFATNEIETFIAYKLYMSTHHTNKLFPVLVFHFLLNQKVCYIWDRFRSL